MKLICKDTNKGSITFFTKGKYAFRGVNRNDTTDDVPDPILDGNNYNESIQFYSKTPGMCEVDWGDGNKEQFPFVKDRSESIYGRYRLMFRRRDISYRKNPDSHPWWFYKEDGSEYVPAPNHAYDDGMDKERVISMSFTNDVTMMESYRIMMVGFPILDMPSLINIIISIPGDRTITDIPKDRIMRSVNIERITLSEFGVDTLTSIPEDWNRLTKLKGLNLSKSIDFSDTEASNIRKFPSMWPNLEMLHLAGGRVRVYPREWLSFSKLRELYISPGVAMPSFDPNTCPAMDEVDRINSSLKIFSHINGWYGSVVSWHPYMSGKGLENIESLDASRSYSNIDVSNLPDYIYEMRSMNSFYMYFCVSTQSRCDTFISTLYDKVMGFNYLTMSSYASDGERNQFYGLYLTMYSASSPVDKRPSGVLQAPSGFIKGQSNGSPSTPMEMVYVLMNNYRWRFSMAPEASVLRSIRSSDIDTRLYKPYKLIVFDDGRTFVGNGDVLAHDTDKVLSFGGQPEGEYLCDSMGLDRNVIVEYFNKIGNG
jgi:hypothetical protein